MFSSNLKKRSNLLQRWRCSCKLKNRRIGSWKKTTFSWLTWVGHFYYIRPQAWAWNPENRVFNSPEGLKFFLLVLTNFQARYKGPYFEGLRPRFSISKARKGPSPTPARKIQARTTSTYFVFFRRIATTCKSVVSAVPQRHESPANVFATLAAQQNFDDTAVQKPFW
jgi:hypothetical protein